MGLTFQSAAQALRRAPCDFVGTYELSLYLRCHRKTIERLVARGVLRPIRVGRNFRFSRAEVIEALGSEAAAPVTANTQEHAAQA